MALTSKLAFKMGQKNSWIKSWRISHADLDQLVDIPAPATSAERAGPDELPDGEGAGQPHVHDALADVDVLLVDRPRGVGDLAGDAPAEAVAGEVAGGVVGEGCIIKERY